MFRKLTLAIAAAASLGAVALSANTASAGPMIWPHHHHHNHWGHGYGPGFSVGFVGGGYGGCYVTRRVLTPHGFRWRTVNICY